MGFDGGADAAHLACMLWKARYGSCDAAGSPGWTKRTSSSQKWFGLRLRLGLGLG